MQHASEHSNKTLFDFTVKSIDGKEVHLSEYKGKAKAFLIVNVASACGYTDGNYKELQAIYQELHPKGLEIFGFPCNQFGAQESKCELDIKKFAQEKFKVTFPLFTKVEVNGDNAIPLYKWLKHGAGNLADIKWNFAKFIVDGHGHVKKYKLHSESPNTFKHELEELLK